MQQNLPSNGKVAGGDGAESKTAENQWRTDENRSGFSSIFRTNRSKFEGRNVKLRQIDTEFGSTLKFSFTMRRPNYV